MKSLKLTSVYKSDILPPHILSKVLNRSHHSVKDCVKDFTISGVTKVVLQITRAGQLTQFFLIFFNLLIVVVAM
jgi:hypothetical protein